LLLRIVLASLDCFGATSGERPHHAGPVRRTITTTTQRGERNNAKDLQPKVRGQQRVGSNLSLLLNFFRSVPPTPATLLLVPLQETEWSKQAGKQASTHASTQATNHPSGRVSRRSQKSGPPTRVGVLCGKANDSVDPSFLSEICIWVAQLLLLPTRQRLYQNQRKKILTATPAPLIDVLEQYRTVA